MMRIFKKGAEFYTCARHLHLRGCNAVLDECRPIVADLKMLGVSFQDILDRIKSDHGVDVDLETDPFLKSIKAIFEIDGINANVTDV